MIGVLPHLSYYSSLQYFWLHWSCNVRPHDIPHGALREDLGFPLDAVEIVRNICKTSTPSYIGNYFGTTCPIEISRGIIQGETHSPYLFITFLQPLLRWLEKDNMGFHFNIPSTCTITIYVHDLAIITHNIQHIQPQICKLQKFAEWLYMDLNII